jgi:hypothetical protein
MLVFQPYSPRLFFSRDLTTIKAGLMDRTAGVRFSGLPARPAGSALRLSRLRSFQRLRENAYKIFCLFDRHVNLVLVQFHH